MLLHLIVSLAALAIGAVLIVDFVMAYHRSTSSGLQRWIDAGRGSATIVVAQLGAIAAALVTAGDTITDAICGILNAPGAADQIKAALSQYVTPTDVGLVMLVFTGLVVWARSRSLNKA